MSADRFGITTDELRYRERAKPKPTTPREFRCDECGARCTRTLRGREAGHRKGCSRRLQRLGKGKRAPPASDGGDGDDGKLRTAVVDAVQLGGRRTQTTPRIEMIGAMASSIRSRIPARP